MGPFTCVQEGAVLVFIGSFNPTLYQPRWLGKVGLLPEKDAADAVINVILPDLASFKVRDWLSVEATINRLQISTEKVENALLLRDFGVNLFRLLEHTPLVQAGLNRSMHFKYSAADDRMTLGTRLAPPVEWPPALEGPLMTSLTMQAKRAGSTAETINVTVEPSKLPGIEQPFGVFIKTNEHYVAGDDEGATAFAARVGSEFDAAFPFARAVSESLLKGERRGK